MSTQATENTEHVNYNPERLLDTLIKKLHLKNDAALSRALEVAPPIVSKLRNRRLPVGATILIRMHEASDISIKELRALMGDTRDHFRQLANLPGVNYYAPDQQAA